MQLNSALIVFFIVFMSSALIYTLVYAFSDTSSVSSDKPITVPKNVTNANVNDQVAYDPFLEAKKVFGEIGACCG